MKIFINAGHGGKDSGAVSINGFLEKDINKTNKLMKNLENNLNGYIEADNTNGAINPDEIEKIQYKK